MKYIRNTIRPYQFSPYFDIYQVLNKTRLMILSSRNYKAYIKRKKERLRHQGLNGWLMDVLWAKKMARIIKYGPTGDLKKQKKSRRQQSKKPSPL